MQKNVFLWVMMSLSATPAWAAADETPSNAPRLDPLQLKQQIGRLLGMPYSLDFGPVPDAPEAKPSEISLLPKGHKEWTVMLYLNGKNNLSKDIMRDLQEAQNAGSDQNINVVAEIGNIRNHKDETSFRNWSGTRRYYLPSRKSLAFIETFESPVADQNMGDWRHLREFISWSQRNFPARRYMLVIGGHGSGWGLSPDDLTGGEIQVKELAQALESGFPIDLFASDACLMQRVEVVYELRRHVRVVVGSQETEPGSGYYYTAVLKALADRPSIDTEELGSALVEAYHKQYKPSGERITISAVRAGKVESLREKLDSWVAAVRGQELHILAQGRHKTVSYGDDARDLYGFIAAASRASLDPEVDKRAKDLLEFIDREFVISSESIGSPGAFGISIYAPARSYRSEYDQLSWAKSSAWDELIAPALD